MKKVKLAFAGTGFMGQRAHMANYHELGDCEIIAIAEPRQELGRSVAARYGIPTVYKDHKELLADCRPDAIVASQPYKHHINLIPDILRAGVLVFTEKPLAFSVESGEKLAGLAESTGTLHMVGYHKRSDPAVEYAKSVINEWTDSGEFGKMNYVRITMPPGDWVRNADKIIRTDEDYPMVSLEETIPGFSSEETKEYDIFVNYYIHQVNLMRHLMGEPYRLSYADESGMFLSVRSESGICGVIEMAIYNNTTDWQESALVCFEKGYVLIELPAPLSVHLPGKVTVMKDSGKSLPVLETPILPNISAMRNQAVNFLKAVRGERPAPCVSSEAVEDLKIARDYINAMRQY